VVRALGDVCPLHRVEPVAEVKHDEQPRNVVLSEATPYAPLRPVPANEMPAIGRPRKPKTAPSMISPVRDGVPVASLTVFDRATEKVVYAVGRDEPVPADIERVHTAFRNFVQGESFPCAGGKSAVKRASAAVGVYEAALGDGACARQLAADLSCFIEYQTREWKDGNNFTTFVAVFPDQQLGDEDEFEARLFRELQALHDADEAPWPKGATRDPKNTSFHFAFGGRKFFVVGLHPNSSRPGRSFEYPAMVFNAMDQFAALQNAGTFDNLQKAIRARDRKMNGSINPNLEFHHAGMSPAHEYSGKAHHRDRWHAPLQIRADKKAANG
jgi:uncharacterized protein